MKRLALLLLVCALLIQSVAAIGISPPKASINFQPESSGAFDVLIINSRAHPIDAVPTVSGDLAQYFTAETVRVGGRGRQSAEIAFALPQDITPGNHRQIIWYVEEFHDPDAGMFATRTRVGLIIDVWKPYPGRYATMTLTPQHVRTGERTNIRADIASRGDQPLSGELRVTVRTPEGGLVDEYIMPDFAVGANSDKHHYFEVRSEDWKPGKYQVTGAYDYGAGVAEAEASLKLGEQTAIINSVTDAMYLSTAVNRFDVEVESMWNDPLPELSASLQLGANSGRTPSITLAGFETKSLTGYWETDASLGVGNHTALVTVTFRDGEPVTKAFTVEVLAEPVAPRQEEPAVELGLTDVLFLVVMIALLIGFVAYKISNHRRRA